MIRLAISIVLVLSSASASAGTVTGQVKFLTVREADNLHYVVINGIETGRPSCAAATNYLMIKNEDSNTGRSQFASLLSAKISGTPVTIIGAGTCTRWGDGEDINSVILNP